MKRTILYLVACMLLITSCQEDGEELFRLQLDQLEGEWVYDAPQEGVWEVQKIHAFWSILLLQQIYRQLEVPEFDE